MYLIGALIWLWISFLVARWLARLVARKVARSGVKPLITLLLLPVIFVAPLADEIVGKYQYDQLCEEAKEVKIHATHPVGEELYTADGKWRFDALREKKARGEIATSVAEEESKHLRERSESLLRWDTGGAFPEAVPGSIPIRKWRTKIIDRTDGRLLAEWTQYGTSGGWLGRSLGGAVLMKAQCVPRLFASGELAKHILPFKNEEDDQK